MNSRNNNLNNFLKNTLNKIINDKITIELRNKKISPNILINEITKAVEISLKCEREDLLQKTIKELEIVKNEKNQIFKEFEDFKNKSYREKCYLEDENNNLRKKFDNIFLDYKTINWKTLQNEEKVFEINNFKNKKLNKYLNIIKFYKNQNLYIKDELKKLKIIIFSNLKQQLKFLKYSKKNYQNKTEDFIFNL